MSGSLSSVFFSGSYGSSSRVSSSGYSSSSSGSYGKSFDPDMSPRHNLDKDMVFLLPCIQQLNNQRALTLSKLRAYQQLMGKEITDFGSVLKHCRNLKTMNLSRVFQNPDSESEKNVLNKLIAALVEHCPELETLNLSECSAVTDTSLAVLGDDPKNLASLNLKSCRYSSKGLKFVLTSYHNLSQLNLSGNAIDDALLIFIAKFCPFLVDLDLSGSCDSITDESVAVLAKDCCLLTYLDIPASKITDAGLQALGNHGQNLQYLNLQFCAHITEKGLNALKSSLPYLLEVLESV